MNIQIIKESETYRMDITADVGYGVSVKINKRQYEKISNFFKYLQRLGEE